MVSFYLFILYCQVYGNSLLCVLRSMVHPNIYIIIYHLNRYQTFIVFNIAQSNPLNMVFSGIFMT